jgi:hypothetical protein
MYMQQQYALSYGHFLPNPCLLIIHLHLSYLSSSKLLASELEWALLNNVWIMVVLIINFGVLKLVRIHLLILFRIVEKALRNWTGNNFLHFLILHSLYFFSAFICFFLFFDRWQWIKLHLCPSDVTASNTELPPVSVCGNYIHPWKRCEKAHTCQVINRIVSFYVYL